MSYVTHPDDARSKTRRYLESVISPVKALDIAQTSISLAVEAETLNASTLGPPIRKTFREISYDSVRLGTTTYEIMNPWMLVEEPHLMKECGSPAERGMWLRQPVVYLFCCTIAVSGGLRWGNRCMLQDIFV